MRGEDHTSRRYPDPRGGSPPHARGRPLASRGVARLGGITPACAGKTRNMTREFPIKRDHPRMRGEDPYPLKLYHSACGSPPHARGRRGQGRARRRLRWITPACAGKTCPSSLPDQGSWDHPRMRGEDRNSVKRHYPRPRITPACAGKTPLARTDGCPSSDHPRMRGEDKLGGGGDHPRMRGEDYTSIDVIRGQLGSPPHARGRRGEVGVVGDDVRITPACAGKTGTYRHRGCRRDGSPPHARGRPQA